MRVVVTGGSGLLGRQVVRVAASRHVVVAMYFGTSRETVMADQPTVQWLRVDLRDQQAMETCFNDLRPDVVIHCAAMADVDRCTQDPDGARIMNVRMVEDLVDIANRQAVHVIGISTDSVFNGERSWYAEEDAPEPLSTYAKTKLAGESVVLDRAQRGLVVRTNFFGWTLPGQRMNLATWIVQALRAGETITGFTDVYFSPLFVTDAAEYIVRLAEAKTTGLLHLAGRTRCSKYDFACRLAQAFGLNQSRIRAGSMTEGATFTARRPRDTSLSTARAAAVFGCALPTIDEGIEKFYHERMCETSAQELVW